MSRPRRPKSPLVATAWRREVAIVALLVAALLAGCGGGGGAPSGVATGSPTSRLSPAATPADSGSAPSGGPSASSAVGPDAGAALEAFRAFIQTDQTFHLQADMQVTIGGRTVDMDVAADVAGADEHGDMIIRSGDASVHLEIVVLDGVAYGKVANRDWEVIPVDTSSSNPLGDLAMDGLAAIGVVNVGGTRTHQFRVEDPAAIDTSIISGTSVTDVTLDTLSFDVYVTDDGAPLAAVMAFAGSGVVEGERQPLQARIRYDFSRFGEPVTIEKPI